MSGRRIVFLAAGTGGLLATGYGAMFTLLDDYRNEYGIQSGALGIMIGVGFFVSFLAQIGLAPLADRGHAKKLIALGVGLNVVGLLAMGFGTSLGPLLIGRGLTGLGAGMALPALRKIVIVSDPDRLGENMGTLLAADVAGFASGPVIAAVLAPLGLAAPYIFIAAATLAIVPVLLRAPVDENVGEPPTQRFALDLLHMRPVAGAVVMGLAVFVMIGMFDTLWSLVLDDLDASDWVASIGITLFAMPLLFLGRAGGRLTHRLGPFRVATVGLILGAFFMLSYGFLPNGYLMLAVGMFHGINDGLTVTGTGVAIAMVAPQERQAGAQGLLGGAQTLCGGLAAILAGWLYGVTSRAVTYLVCASVMLVLIGLGAWLAGPNWNIRPDTEAVGDTDLAGQAVGSASTATELTP